MTSTISNRRSLIKVLLQKRDESKKSPGALRMISGCGNVTGWLNSSMSWPKLILATSYTSSAWSMTHPVTMCDNAWHIVMLLCVTWWDSGKCDPIVCWWDTGQVLAVACSGYWRCWAESHILVTVTLKHASYNLVTHWCKSQVTSLYHSTLHC